MHECQTTKPVRSTTVQVELGVEPGVVLLDIGFTEEDPKHGFLTGTRQTLLETFDGGKRWEPRYIESVDEEGINYRYNSVSFHGNEGWMVGKPGAPRGIRACAHDGGHGAHVLAAGLQSVPYVIRRVSSEGVRSTAVAVKARGV